MNYLEQVSAQVRLEEGPLVIEQLLLECYLNPGISTKSLARKTFLPVPIAAAIKKELIKAGALAQGHGVRCTLKAKTWIEQCLGYAGLNQALYRKLLTNQTGLVSELSDTLSVLQDIFDSRPEANVQLDQSKCTAETSLKRAVLCLKEHSLIGKRILCVGDDDLVSVAIALLLQCLFPNEEHNKTRIDVIDIDRRFLTFIREVSEKKGLSIHCIHQDLRQPISEQFREQYDCFFTDPPYTLQGMNLFVSRGLTALKKKKGLPIFLSFAHKSPEFMLTMQHELVRLGLTVSATFPHFNVYEGAEMIANQSQMFILKTTEHSTRDHMAPHTGPLYTGEIKRSLRTYCCKQCGGAILVGDQGSFPTIEQLKNEAVHTVPIERLIY